MKYLFLDYHFLEDVGRFVDSSHRDRVCMAKEQNDSRELKQNVRPCHDNTVILYMYYHVA